MNAESAVRDKQILIVDDDELVLNTIEHILESCGAKSQRAANGHEALQSLKTNQPDLMLLDYMMPDMSGAEVIAAISDRDDLKHCRNIPIVMLTAKTNNYREQTELLEKGLSAYLFKPFGQKELINVISNLLTIHKMQEENRQLHDRIRDIKIYLQSIFDNITDSISVQSKDYRIERINKGTAQIFLGTESGPGDDFDYEMYKGKTCHKTFFDLDQPCEYCPANQTIQSGTPAFSEIHNKPAGRFFEIHTYPLFDKEGRVSSFIETIRDVTSKKELENQLIESSRLASVGSLAAGVAHEINNPLCIILGFTQSLLEEADEGSTLREELQIIEDETSRCAKVVQDLLTYAKPGPLEKEKANIKVLLKNSLGLLRYQFNKKELRVSEMYPATIPAIEIDKNKIQQVFVNLLLNAIQASNQKGEIEIRLTLERKDQRMRVEIIDHGEGMNPAELKRIFDPFYTTKKAVGTGLGLSICQSIIQDHKGQLSVDSSLRKGTRVEVMLSIE